MNEKQLTHGSLFTGIGGFDLAAHWAGIKNVFQVEKDKFCNKVLEKYFPDAKRYKDIKEFSGTKYKGRIDIVSGGFPCQPFSIAGKRKGKADDRHLWDEMLRVIKEIEPKWIVGENVANLWNMGLENMLAQVEGEGYEVETFVIPALAVGAPHKRDRIWIVANNRLRNEQRKKKEGKSGDEAEKEKTFEYKRSVKCNGIRTVTDNTISRYEGGKQDRQRKKRNISQDTTLNTNADNSKTERQRRYGREILSITESKRPSGDYWERDWYEVATEFCRVDDGVPNRVDRLKSLGNAVVPQIPYILFEAIKKIECHLK